MKFVIRVTVICVAGCLMTFHSAQSMQMAKKRSLKLKECLEMGGEVKNACLKEDEVLGRVIDGNLTADCCRKAHVENMEKYLTQVGYCETDADCRIRQGACGPEAMNIYFDNTELIEMQPYVECSEYIPFNGARCQSNVCVGIKMPSFDRLRNDEQVMCAMDAKLCPDGSYVGRVPPDCKFKECPGE